MTGLAVLGLGGSIDYELDWDVARLEAAIAELDIVSLEDSPPLRIDSERALLLSILTHLRDGLGGEHFVETPDIIEKFSTRFTYRIALGGTAVRAALTMSDLGIRSTVHLVSIDNNVRRLLPSNINFISSAQKDSLDPHVIIQYPAGACVRIGGGMVRSTRANRLIYPSDQPNRYLVLSDQLPEVLSRAQVFLISGLNAIQDRDILDERLAQIVVAMESLPATAVVLYEDAAFHEPAFSWIVRDALAPHSDFFSLNEDELVEALGHPVDLLDPADVATAVSKLRTRVGVPFLLLHSRYYALAHGVQPWSVRSVLEAGVAAASARYVFGDLARSEDVSALSLHGQRSVSGQRAVEQIEALGSFCGVPAFDLQNTMCPTTIGLGDAFVGGAVAALLQCPRPGV
ncbi:MAG: hypothetical protein B5766_10370 [Candidatus Lumbricidophila eiseniae]|uniref:ADP-dependent phosphofructokinase/glucokinase n=1 Tax=Candidatus Lumbricidiphila eiseniae TaxID=1969409 RepID=A0A2A6FNY4_9MICO|nr:MAG: hypothetical protein B5766_10370 [Candidatus Lumbricidophila eiseniae]